MTEFLYQLEKSEWHLSSVRNTFQNIVQNKHIRNFLLLHFDRLLRIEFYYGMHSADMFTLVNSVDQIDTKWIRRTIITVCSSMTTGTRPTSLTLTKVFFCVHVFRTLAILTSKSTVVNITHPIRWHSQHDSQLINRHRREMGFWCINSQDIPNWFS